MDDSAILAKIRVASEKINEKHKLRVSVPGDEFCWSDIPFYVPTRSFLLNKILSDGSSPGGTPLGRVIEIYGDPSVGKSTILEHMMVGFQEYPGISVLLDADTGWSRKRAIAMGHNENRHLHLQADTIELGVEVILSTITRLRMPGSGFPLSMPIGFFWDAITSSQTEGEKEGDKYKDGMGDKARKVRDGMRRIVPILAKEHCALIFACHTIVEFDRKYGGGGAKKKSATHGDSIKFHASKRIKVWVSGQIDYPESQNGIITTAKVIKDKLQRPLREVNFPVMFRTGIHYAYELVNFLIDNSSYVNQEGSRIVIPDYPEDGDRLSFYRKDLEVKLARFPDLVDYLSVCADMAWTEKYG